MFRYGDLDTVVDEMVGEPPLSSLEYFFEIYDEREEEREYLHHRIVEKILNRKKWSTGKSIYMLGGAPANGKSTFVNSKVVTYPEAALKVDPDEIKGMLPEYQAMIERGVDIAAELMHEESSLISKKLRQAAIDQGYDIILDGVANDTIEKRMEDVENLKSKGHYIRIDYVTLDTALSLQLAEIRFQRTRRKVPDQFVKDKNRVIAALMPQLIENKVFDELYLWDTNQENNPRLILSHKNGILEVASEALYENFKKKANEQDSN